ncbi:hypothetical protein PsorP6_000708 [Peronosclerospora sorghi]|uniref:Uncharacterized protein n=1 Tax=Peronosclerospora sorghi TaxID=230839 RepID=A0ACC0WXH8_9STRA|nr:hypothetical protein PsorP6_000708 [Peronosclerospora sorghi]
MVNSTGSCAASAKPRIRASGLTPSSRALAPVMSTMAAAPSFKVDAFAAVIVPSFLNAEPRLPHSLICLRPNIPVHLFAIAVSMRELNMAVLLTLAVSANNPALSTSVGNKLAEVSMDRDTVAPDERG